MTGKYSRFKTDKAATFPGFDRMADYERHLGDRRRRVNLLELGVLDGESLLLWRAFFPNSTIVGIDRKLPMLIPPKGVTLFEGEQDDREFLAYVAKAVGPFDVIVDDCSHFGDLSKASFWSLFLHLKSGGLYVVEDWGTGYLKDWPDGHAYKAPRTSPLIRKLARGLGIKLRWPCYSYGMVGFVKELIDQMDMFDIKRQTVDNLRGGVSPFENMVITTGAVIITKRKTL